MTKKPTPPTAFNELWPDLLKAWVLHMIWVAMTVILPALLGIWAYLAYFDDAGSRWWMPLLFLLPVFFLGWIMSIVAPWRYLKQRGFETAILIAVVSAIIGIMLPFGSILGFLIVGYFLESEARKR